MLRQLAERQLAYIDVRGHAAPPSPLIRLRFNGLA